jgi:hypothetical protein
MATSYNTNNGLSLTVVAEKALPFLQPIVAPFNAFSTDFSPEVNQVGAGIYVRYASARSASVWGTTNGYLGANASTATSNTITLAGPFYDTVTLSPLEVATIGEDKLVNTYVGPLIQSVANEAAKQVYNLVTIANFPVASYSGSSGFGFNALLSGSQVLNKSGSQTPRTTILNPNIHPQLVADLKQSYYIIPSPTVISENRIGKIVNAETYIDSLLQSNNQGLAGFTCGGEALAMASRVPMELNQAGVEYAYVAGPGGFTVQLQRYSVGYMGTVNYTAAVLFGACKGIPGALVRYVDTANP